MYDTTLAKLFQLADGFIVKTDHDGTVQWIRQFKDAEPHRFYRITVFNLFQLPDKDIIAIADVDTTFSDYRDATVIFRLDENGNLKSTTQLTTSLAPYVQGVPITIKTVADGLNGDLIFCGTTQNNTGDGLYETVIRIDAAGKVIWDANYGNAGDYHGGADAFGAFVTNNNIIVCGQSFGDGDNKYLVALNFLQFDYATGNLTKKVFIVPPAGKKDGLKSIASQRGYCLRLNNGNYVLYGATIDSYTISTDTVHEFAVAEFDTNFNLVSAYTIAVPPGVNVVNTLINIYPDGKALYVLSRYFTDNFFTEFLIQENDNQVLKSRKLRYTNSNVSVTAGVVPLADNGYVYMQSHAYKHNGINNYVEFKKLHNTDTASNCLGTDSLFTSHVPYNLVQSPGYKDLDDNLPDKTSPAYFKITVSDTLTYNTQNGCVQKNYCDTVSIHGKTSFCGADNTVLFTSYKNQNCGAFTQWSIDTSVITSLQQLNNTTVAIKFKNVNWNGNLYAMLPAAKCFMDTPTDFLQLHIVQVNRTLNLGNDTMLCGTDISLTIHAGAGFKTYQWQDGSADSTFTVTKAGKYFVIVTDYCDNVMHDTINIKQANDVFSIGNDTSKCNGDTIVLQATGGFTNYNWQPQYNLIKVDNNAVKVYPGINTSYYASAQTSGCTFYDTVHVNVLHPPAIDFGNDTSICSGTSIQLNAGSGFTGNYWNTGAATQTIYAGNAGNYNVTASANNGCSSSDTLIIIAVKPLPVFSLEADTGICKNESVNYKLNLSNALYYWSTGNQTNTQTITMPGTYWLRVTQSLCSASDTVIIYQKLSPQVYLGCDTVLCEGDTKLLNADYTNADYMWQDGSTVSQYIVTRAGLYYVKLNLNDCTASDSININYNAKPFFNLGNDTMICNGTQILLQPLVNVPVIYFWQDGSTLPYYNITQPGIFHLSAGNNCGLYTDSLVIYNRWGQQVFVSQDINKGWDGTYKGFIVSHETFVWVLSVTDINNKTTNQKGTVMVIQ